MQNLVRSKTIGVTGNGGRGTAGAGPGRDLLYNYETTGTSTLPKVVGPHLAFRVSGKYQITGTVTPP